MPPNSLEIVDAVAPDRRFDPAGGVVVATDAAVHAFINRAASGFLATSGLYGVAAHPQPPDIVGTDVVTVAELRAVWRAVSALASSALEQADEALSRAKVTILSDSKNALRYLRDWKAGREVYPTGYKLQAERPSGDRSSLEKLAELMGREGRRYVLAKVAGHTGHSLNEAADSLARLGLRSGSRNGVTVDEARRIAAAYAATRLRDYWAENR